MLEIGQQWKLIKTSDNLRGLGICLIVLGHAASMYSRWIYLFHGPLFFISSGYFFKDAVLASPLKFLLRRLRALYLPFVG